jgi:hypothetical protein
MKTPLIIFLLILHSVATPHAQVTFTDVTQSAGVANTVGNQARLGTNVAWGDFDGDGDLDLYVTNWGSSVSQAINRLYSNNGNGTFTDIASSAGVADGAFRNSVDAHWIDYDNDGDLDLYITEFFSQDQLYRNNGNGSFSNVTGSAGVNVISQGDETAAAWADFNNDGNIDLYICKKGFRNTLFHNNGDGSFSEIGATAGVNDIRDTRHAAWGDYDNDGDADLYIVNEQNNVLFKNEGTGSFEEIVCAVENTDEGRNASWIDHDSDGDLDLFVANIGANALYKNNGNDQFANIASGVLKTVSGAWVSWTGAWGDYDNDGDLDLFVANGADSRSGQVSPLLRNNGADAFTDITAGSGLNSGAGSATAASAADFDGDGDLDIYVVNSRFPTFDASQLYRNETR